MKSNLIATKEVLSEENEEDNTWSRVKKRRVYFIRFYNYTRGSDVRPLNRQLIHDSVHTGEEHVGLALGAVVSRRSDRLPSLTIYALQKSFKKRYNKKERKNFLSVSHLEKNRGHKWHFALAVQERGCTCACKSRVLADNCNLADRYDSCSKHCCGVECAYWLTVCVFFLVFVKMKWRLIFSKPPHCDQDK